MVFSSFPFSPNFISILEDSRKKTLTHSKILEHAPKKMLFATEHVKSNLFFTIGLCSQKATKSNSDAIFKLYTFGSLYCVSMSGTVW
jgi:hypothetical protein